MITNKNLLNTIHREIHLVEFIPEERKKKLRLLAENMRDKLALHEVVKLIVICTHNSRRSQIGELWIRCFAKYFDIKGIESFSGGTEATALNPRMAHAIELAGWNVKIIEEAAINPVYQIQSEEEHSSQKMYSKKYDDPFNPKENFIAVMVCNDADDACPIVKGATTRISLPFKDPKAFDDTPLEKEKYQECISQTAIEYFYCFMQLKGLIH